MRVIESSKPVYNLAELFPCGIVFLTLSIIELNCLSLFLPKFADRERSTNFRYKKITLTG
ncbi:hypothetical protein E0Z11_10045 [Pasteurella multocida subsp. multocida]|nr:hypothetical protein E0Z11_10045 [Pasteurella multocida subsp. multocida]HAS03867.1 hypothetical protein [Pasteurella multocida]